MFDTDSLVYAHMAEFVCKLITKDVIFDIDGTGLFAQKVDVVRNDQADFSNSRNINGRFYLLNTCNESQCVLSKLPVAGLNK